MGWTHEEKTWFLRASQWWTNQVTALSLRMTYHKSMMSREILHILNKDSLKNKFFITFSTLSKVLVMDKLAMFHLLNLLNTMLIYQWAYQVMSISFSFWNQPGNALKKIIQQLLNKLLLFWYVKLRLES